MEPGAEGVGLALAKVGQWYVDVALGDVDAVSCCCFSQVAGDVAGALSVPHDPNFLWPFLFHEVRQKVILASS
jgi:hypothetical protein